MNCIFDWQQVEGDWQDGPEFRSRREILARKQGLPIYRGIATRRNDWRRDGLDQAISQMAMPVFSIE